MKMKMLLTGITLALLVGCSTEERWDGYFYPSKNSTDGKYTGTFNSLDSCRAATRKDYGTYECGLKSSTGYSRIAK